MAGKRIQWIDIAKGLGILLVIYGHALGGIMNSHDQLATGVLLKPYNIIYGFHMPLFFFLSGIFAAHWVKRNVKLAMKQKVISLVFPYFFWTVITGSIMAVAQRVTNSGLGVKDILLSPIAPFSEYWFLYVLFIVFLTFYFGERLIGNKALFIISLVFFLIRPMIFRYWIFDAFSLNFFFFMIGSLVLQHKNIQNFLTFSRVKLIVSMCLFVMINIGYLKVISSGVYWQSSYAKFLTISIGILMTIYLAQLFEKISILNRTLSWLGQASMAIYVMHLVPIAGARIIALKFLGVTDVVGLSFIISGIALVVCIIGYYVFEKFRIGRLSLGQGLN
ncbi:acyltransferase family protein [Levilactobacillus acidifarinae]|uniref:Cps1E protein n=1 Tax=Levilactobacillus acidifarinae DSM 19394 = JCM 15949 TaxID=1423715 RepID=A0A0R1LI08_9LACO|nr:acyltransferase [Levilactobacillus acidifarinae]KRK95128.1 cps1E protein [Levilactobacillus acidifarinae DSM 19394]GEO70627.1 acyltransferase/acetyltransferase [Levilactobacillus acidifarinae]